ncbi:MAG: hypothetical protein Q8Q52_01240 [Acidimicrobiia bacterium]|nr:hypothetical protein [Acidimicrobiia bacterium]
MIRVVRLVLALAIAVAVFGNLAIASGRPTFNPVNYFSYFTILSNVAAAALLAVQGIRNTTVSPL